MKRVKILSSKSEVRPVKAKSFRFASGIFSNPTALMPKDGIARLQKICPRLMPVYGLTESSANIVFGEEGASLDEMAETIESLVVV